jgi:hypothetical protein
VLAYRDKEIERKIKQNIKNVGINIPEMKHGIYFKSKKGYKITNTGSSL